MKLRTIILASLIVPMFYTAQARAAEGVVVYKEYSCDYYIVNTQKGFSLQEHFSGREPNIGDVIVGDYESYGMKNIYNLSSNSEYRAYIEDFWLSKQNVSEKYIDKCY